VTAAAKSASLPAVYSRALVALEEAISELSFDKLKQVEISAEGLAAWAKAHQDTKLTKTVRELKFRARRTANYIAEQLVKQRRAAFIARGGVTRKGNVPLGEPERANIKELLHEAGYSAGEVHNIRNAGYAPDNCAQMNGVELASAARGKKPRSQLQNTVSDIYRVAFMGSNSPLTDKSWFRQNSARGIARRLTSSIDIEKSKQTITLIHAWCEEFLKNLPRAVSKAKAS